MTESNSDFEKQIFSEMDYCPICGELALSGNKHKCPQRILDNICKEEEERSSQIDDDDEKDYGERLDDAEFMLNYYDNDFDEDE